MNHDQATYLEAMGISTWQRRQSASLESLRYYSLSDGSSGLIAYVICELNSAEEESLLLNIMKALQADLMAINQDQLTNQNITQLVFGYSLEQILMKESRGPRMLLCSLSDMLHNPALKKELWLKLKSFRGI